MNRKVGATSDMVELKSLISSEYLYLNMTADQLNPLDE